MNKQPYISVVIPTYNRADYIADALRSVLNQKGKWAMEVIVADDGSTDDTQKIVKTFGAKVRYIKLPHSGRPAGPRNAGIKAAKGELIAFLDSDDLWTADKFAKQIPLFEDEKIVLTYGNAEQIDAGGQPLNKLVVKPKVLGNAQSFEKLVTENVISTLTVVAKKSALEAVGGFNELPSLKTVEDYELWLRVAAAYPRGIKGLHQTLAYYRVHPENVSAADALLAVERLLIVYEQTWEVNLSAAQRTTLGRQIVNMQEGWTRLKIEAGDVPVVSVVMSVYNGGEYLSLAIKSILDQTLKDFEFIIIDDGSQDESVQTIQKFKDPRIRLVRQTNYGLVDSLNKAMRLARSGLIARMDADDISLPSRLEQELSLMHAHPRAGVVGTFFTYIDDPGDKAITITSPFKQVDLKRALYIENPYAHGSVMFRKEAFAATGGYSKDFGPTEDYALWPEIADGWDLRIIPEILYLYRISSGSISQTSGDSQAKYSRQIQSRQWHKPFVYKNPRQIIKDGKFYRDFNSTFAQDIYEKYINQQRIISVELFGRGRLALGIANSMGACWLRPRLVFGLSRSFVGCLLRISGVMAKRN